LVDLKRDRRLVYGMIFKNVGAAAGASLDDPYSHYYDPSDYHSFQNETDPHLSGIGIDIEAKPGGVDEKSPRIVRSSYRLRRRWIARSRASIHS